MGATGGGGCGAIRAGGWFPNGPLSLTGSQVVSILVAGEGRNRGRASDEARRRFPRRRGGPHGREERVTNREGSVIGAYRLIRLLGAGGAGEVYLAEGPYGEAGVSQVAVKVLSGAASDPTARDIARQAQAAGALTSSHMLPFVGVVEQGETLALVTALAPGGSLGDTLRARGADGTPKLALPLAPGVVARLVTQLARALGTAHAAGLVHGDLKPSNMFVRTAPSGAPLAAVGDFGQGVLTQAAGAVASGAVAQVAPERRAWAATQLRFAAPEQLRGERVPASDQYALAAVAYYLLTGKPPVTAEPGALPAAIAGGAVPPPSQLAPELTEAADAVFARALAKAPERRYATIEAFAAALDEALAESAAGAGLTQQFASLAAPGTSGRRPTGAPARGTATDRAGGTSGVRVIDRSEPEGRRGRRAAAPSAPLPEDAPPGVNRPLAILSGVAVLIGLLACVLAFHAVQGSAALPKLGLNGYTLPGQAPQATPTANAAQAATAQAAVRRLASATAGRPLYADTLSGGSAKTGPWHPNGKSVFFGADGLHLSNASATSALAADAPASPSLDLAQVAARVDVTFVRGDTGGLAGIRFFTRPAAGGDAVFYCYVISPQGRYEVWVRHGSPGSYSWDAVLSGYSDAIKTGMNVTNTIAVVADSGTNDALLFANGQYVTRVNLGLLHAYSDAPTSGTVGLLVLFDNSEVAFSHLAVYGN